MPKLAGWLAGAVLAAGLVFASGPSAGAAGSAACTFTVTTSGSNTVDIAGMAEVPSVFVRAFVNGSQVATVQADSGGDFSFTGITGRITDTISVSYGPTPTSTYPMTSCDPVHVSSEVVVSPAAQVSATSLAFTGSSHTPSLALAGLAAALVGGVLVLFARRRRSSAPLE